MQKEVYFVEKLLENKKRELMRSSEAWKEYLDTAGRNFKYDHVDTMLIEAQQRESSTLASEAFWIGKPFNRRLKKDAIGIAVLRTEGKKRVLNISTMYRKQKERKMNDSNRGSIKKNI